MDTAKVLKCKSASLLKELDLNGTTVKFCHLGQKDKFPGFCGLVGEHSDPVHIKVKPFTWMDFNNVPHTQQTGAKCTPHLDFFFIKKLTQFHSVSLIKFKTAKATTVGHVSS